MSTVPPLLAGLLPLLLLLELLLQAAAPRAPTAAMAAIAVVRLMLPFLSLIGPGRAGDPPDTDRRSRIRDKGLALCPRRRNHNQGRAGPMAGARHGSPWALLPCRCAADSPRWCAPGGA